MPTILVGDTNIWIDLREGNLLDGAFALPVTFVVPDFLYEDELADFEGPDLVERGLVVEALAESEVEALEELSQSYARPSKYDLSALALALSRKWILLTGDGDLRQAAAHRGCEVHGTLWLMKFMVKEGLLTLDQLESRSESMRRSGRRLPKP